MQGQNKTSVTTTQSQLANDEQAKDQALKKKDRFVWAPTFRPYVPDDKKVRVKIETAVATSREL